MPQMLILLVQLVRIRAVRLATLAMVHYSPVRPPDFAPSISVEIFGPSQYCGSPEQCCKLPLDFSRRAQQMSKVEVEMVGRLAVTVLWGLKLFHRWMSGGRLERPLYMALPGLRPSQ